MAKVWKVPNSVYNSLPKHKAAVHISAPLYTLFEKKDDGWKRIRSQAYPYTTAVRIFGGVAIANLAYAIRKVSTPYDNAQGPSRYRQPSYNWLRDSPLKDKRG